MVSLPPEEKVGSRGEAERVVQVGGGGRQFLGVLTQLLVQIESCAGSGAGSLSLMDPSSGQILGQVMAEKGRLCWANARDCPVSLGRRLQEASGASREHLETIYEECKTDGKPLGEALVERGLVTSEKLRELLAGQVGACVSTLLRSCLEDRGEWSSWEEAPHRTYAPAFTFRSDEVVEEVLAADLEARLGLPPVPARLLETVERHSLSACLLILDEEEGLALPVARGRDTRLTLNEMTTLFRKGLWLLQKAPRGEGGAEPYLALFADESGGSAVARFDQHLLMLHYEDLMSLVPLISWLHRERRMHGEH